jgi:hypothetical protein
MPADLNKDIQVLRAAAEVAQRYEWSQVVQVITRFAVYLKRLQAAQQAEAAGKQGKLL